MFLVNNPRRLNGVALMENLFGDMWVDCLALHIR